MLRKICVASLSMLVVAAGFALDITTIDGTTYKNVQINSITPAGFDISYTLSDGGIGIRELLFKDLPEDVRKKYNYNAQKADAFQKKIQYYQQLRQEEMIKKYEEKMRQEQILEQEEEELSSVVMAGRQNIILNALHCDGGGTVGWASYPDASNTTGQLGKIYLLGVNLPNGGTWSGYAYPTWTSAGLYPCYAASMEGAIIRICASKKPTWNENKVQKGPSQAQKLTE